MESVYQIVTIHVNETSWAHVWRLHSRYLRTGYDIGAGLGPPRLYHLWRPSLPPPHVEEGGDLDPSRKREGDWEERRGSRGEREREIKEPMGTTRKREILVGQKLMNLLYKATNTSYIRR
jgi:hypothetical protein